MRILLIEDDPFFARSIEAVLGRASMSVTSARVGHEGIELATRQAFDLILLDLGLPDMNGQEVVRRLRHGGIDTPVLILSGDDSINSKLQTLNCGADDYMTKPFHGPELVARIHAIGRRSGCRPETVIRVGSISINQDSKRVEVDGQPVHLTITEYRMLEILFARKGEPVSAETFIHLLYRGMDEPKKRIIAVFMCSLRRRLAQAGNIDGHFHTVWRSGFVLREPDREPICLERKAA